LKKQCKYKNVIWSSCQSTYCYTCNFLFPIFTVPSPAPLEILQIEAVKTLLEATTPNARTPLLPIACGGGGVPVARIPANPTTLQGVEAVIDKDACGAKLSTELQADGFIILTDGGGIWYVLSTRGGGFDQELHYWNIDFFFFLLTLFRFFSILFFPEFLFD